MAEFIAPIVNWLVEVLEGMGRFAEVRRSWTGVVVNWPPAAVMARTVEFDSEGSGRHEKQGVTIKFGVNGADPDQLTVDAMECMKAIDDAIAEAAWPAQVSKVFVQVHDYGPLFGDGKGFARFPEMHLEVEAYE